MHVFEFHKMSPTKIQEKFFIVNFVHEKFSMEIFLNLGIRYNSILKQSFVDTFFSVHSQGHIGNKFHRPNEKSVCSK